MSVPAQRVGWMLLILLELVCLMMLIGCKEPPSFSWTGSGNPSLTECTSAVSVECLTGFTLEDQSTGTIIAGPIPITVKSYKMSVMPAKGTHIYSLTVTGKDQSGKPISSPPAKTTVKIP